MFRYGMKLLVYGDAEEDRAERPLTLITTARDEVSARTYAIEWVISRNQWVSRFELVALTCEV